MASPRLLGVDILRSQKKGDIMEFRKNQAIYLQIADLIRTNILTCLWSEGDRITSVREMAAQIEVNPNTVMRAYALLQAEDILSNKRGIGFFVISGAAGRIKKHKKDTFIKGELKPFFKKMELLDIDMEELKRLYESLMNKNDQDD